MLMYLDRNLTEVTKSRWDELIRRPKYTNIVTKRCGSYWVTLSWLGVKSELEKKAKPFCVVVMLHSSKEEERQADTKYHWVESEEEGMALFDKIIKELM